MLKPLLAIALAATVGIAQAESINIKVKPPKGLPGPDVKVKVGDDVKVKGDHGKHKGEFKGKKKGH